MRLTELLNTWNEATAPYVARTESEHAECSPIAREADAAIRAGYVYGRDWLELSNGFRMLVNRWR